MQIRLITFILFLAAAFHSTAHARTCRLIYPMCPERFPLELHLFDGSKSHAISVSGLNFSDLVQLPDGEITLMLTLEAIQDGKIASEDAVSSSLPAEWKDVYLVLLKSKKDTKLPFDLMVLDASDSTIKPGHTLWVNRSPHRVEAELGEQSLTIPPNGEVLSPPPLEASGYFKARFHYAPEGGDKVLPIMQKSWWLDLQSKNLGFVMPMDSGPPRVFSYRDFRSE